MSGTDSDIEPLLNAAHPFFVLKNSTSARYVLKRNGNHSGKKERKSDQVLRRYFKQSPPMKIVY